MLDERKEAKGAVARPFDTDALVLFRHKGFDQAGSLPQHGHLETGLPEQHAVSVPTRLKRGIGVGNRSMSRERRGAAKSSFNAAPPAT